MLWQVCNGEGASGGREVTIRPGSRLLALDRKGARTLRLKGAVEQVGLAGRELGSGPAIVLARFPDLVQELGSCGFREQATLEAVGLGVIYGMLAEGSPLAKARLQEIHEDWARDHAVHGVAEARAGEL